MMINSFSLMAASSASEVEGSESWWNTTLTRICITDLPHLETPLLEESDIPPAARLLAMDFEDLNRLPETELSAVSPAQMVGLFSLSCETIDFISLAQLPLDKREFFIKLAEEKITRDEEDGCPLDYHKAADFWASRDNRRKEIDYSAKAARYNKNEDCLDFLVDIVTRKEMTEEEQKQARDLLLEHPPLIAAEELESAEEEKDDDSGIS